MTERIGARQGEAWRDEKRHVTVKVNKGSGPAPVWALNLVAKVVESEVRLFSRRVIALRWTKGAGGGRYYERLNASLGTVACNAVGLSRGYQTYLLLHELAHMVDHYHATRWATPDSKPHGDGFHDALYRIAVLTGKLLVVRQWHTPKAALTRAGSRYRAKQRPYDPCPRHPSADRMHGCDAA